MPGALSDGGVDRIQLFLVVGCALWRVGLWKGHLQSYIAVAKDRVEKLRKRENKSTQQDIAKSITVVWYVYTGLSIMSHNVMTHVLGITHWWLVCNICCRQF